MRKKPGARTPKSIACEHCKTLYLPIPRRRHVNVAGQGMKSVFGLTLRRKRNEASSFLASCRQQSRFFMQAFLLQNDPLCFSLGASSVTLHLCADLPPHLRLEPKPSPGDEAFRPVLSTTKACADGLAVAFCSRTPRSAKNRDPAPDGGAWDQLARSRSSRRRAARARGGDRARPRDRHAEDENSRQLRRAYP